MSNNFGDNISRIINDAVNTMDFSGFSRDINSAVKDAVFGPPSLDDIKLSDEGRANGNANSSANMGASGSTGANASGYEWQNDPFMDLAGRAARDP